MRLLYSKVFKNYQVNVGVPFKIQSQMNYNTVKNLDIIEPLDEDIEEPCGEDPEQIRLKAEEEAELIKKEAEYEARRIIENANKEAADARALIEEEARQSGYQDGYTEAQSQYEALLQEVELIKQSAKVEYEEVLAGIENDAVKVVLEIAKKVIGIELRTNRESILYMVKEAFNKCSNKEKMTLKLAPDDYEFVEEYRDKLFSVVEGIGELDIKRDCSLKEGSCIVETPYGSIDAGVHTKVENIEEAFIQMCPVR